TFLLTDRNSYALRMRGKLRRVHALNSCNTIAEISCMCYKQRILEHISSFAQETKEKIGACVSSRFIITETVLPFIATQHIRRLKRRSSHVFHVHIFHVTIHSQFNSYFYFITHP